jgi:hypothetical protein
MVGRATGRSVVSIEASTEPVEGPDGKPAEGTTDMLHPTVMLDLAKSHQDELRAEAEAERLAKSARAVRTDCGRVDRFMGLFTGIRKPVVEVETPHAA